MWGRRPATPVHLPPGQLAKVVRETAAGTDQDDTADYHNGTPYGQTPWWERVRDHTDDDSDGM